MTILAVRVRGPFSGNSQYFDKALQTGAIAVNQDNYSTDPDSTVLDRVYNVKGLNNMYVEIENTGGTNGLTYKITKARKEFATITTLVDADFDEEIVGDTNVAPGANDMNTIDLLSPEITAIRVLVKRQVASNDTTLAGILSAN